MDGGRILKNELNVLDLDKYEMSDKTYGGRSGNKIGLLIDGKRYLVKFPGNLKERNMKNVALSYSNSPICEYIGSHIYESIGIPVHKTYLGIRKGKVVVACEDFCNKLKGEYVAGLDEIKTTTEPDVIKSNGSASDGTSGDLEELLDVVDKNHLTRNIVGLKERFWDMFVVDALIGNNDRNNGNWGLIIGIEEKRITPVYDNGNCLNAKWNDEKMEKVICSPELLKKEAYDGRLCFHSINGKKINPYHYIMKMENEDCNKAVERIFPSIDLDKINDIIEDVHNTGLISDIAAKFYRTIMYERYTKVLEPVYGKIKEMNVDKERTEQYIKGNTR